MPLPRSEEFESQRGQDSSAPAVVDGCRKWNFRLTVQTVEGEDVWEIREIYYDTDGTVSNWSLDAVAASGSSWIEWADELAWMFRVVSYPVFDLDTEDWCDRSRKPLAAVKFGEPA